MLFDTVPGGAGGALRIARAFPQVIVTALRHVARGRKREQLRQLLCMVAKQQDGMLLNRGHFNY